MNKLAYYQGYTAKQSLEKRASMSLALYNKVKGLFTGKRYLYHGTSPGKAAKIMKGGLMPNAGGGISELAGMGGLNNGLTFLTKDLNAAKMYGKQQRYIDKPYKSKVNDFFAKYIRGRNSLFSTEQVNALATGSNPLARQGKVLKAVIPKGKLNTVVNPEAGLRDPMTKAYMKTMDVVHQGNIDPKYLTDTGLEEKIVPWVLPTAGVGAAAVGTKLYMDRNKPKDKKS